MNITRRQFGVGLLGGIFMLLFGRIFGCRSAEEPTVHTESAARYWKQADHLAG